MPNSNIETAIKFGGVMILLLVAGLSMSIVSFNPKNTSGVLIVLIVLMIIVSFIAAVANLVKKY